jgi:hypothetical protein
MRIRTISAIIHLQFFRLPCLSLSGGARVVVPLLAMSLIDNHVEPAVHHALQIAADACLSLISLMCESFIILALTRSGYC